MTDQGGGPGASWGANSKDESLTGWMTPDQPNVVASPPPAPPAAAPETEPSGSVAAGSYTYPAEQWEAPQALSQPVSPAETAGPPLPPPPPSGGGWTPGTGGGSWNPEVTVQVSAGDAYTVARLWPRTAAWFVDGVVLALVQTITMGFVASAMGGGLVAPSLPGYQVANVAVGLGIGFLYSVGLWTSGGRATLGMRIFGLQVGNAADGATLTLRQAVIRWAALGNPISALAGFDVLSGAAVLILVVWYLVLLVSTSNDQRRMGLHDRVAESLIVARPGSRGDTASSCLAIGCVVFLLIPLVSLISLIFLGGATSSILSEIGSSI